MRGAAVYGAFADVRADAFLGGIGTRYFSIPRGDLAGALCDALSPRVDTIFADSIASLEQDEAGVTAHFGRMALTGDAAFSPSLMAGEGSALGMLGAYVLAGELAHARGDHARARAFKAYEEHLQGYIAMKQEAAIRFAPSIAPRTALGTFWRNQFMKAMQISWLGKRVLGASFGAQFALPDYG